MADVCGVPRMGRQEQEDTETEGRAGLHGFIPPMLEL